MAAASRTPSFWHEQLPMERNREAKKRNILGRQAKRRMWCCWTVKMGWSSAEQNRWITHLSLSHLVLVPSRGRLRGVYSSCDVKQRVTGTVAGQGWEHASEQIRERPIILLETMRLRLSALEFSVSLYESIDTRLLVPILFLQSTGVERKASMPVSSLRLNYTLNLCGRFHLLHRCCFFFFSKKKEWRFYDSTHLTLQTVLAEKCIPMPSWQVFTPRPTKKSEPWTRHMSQEGGQLPLSGKAFLFPETMSALPLVLKPPFSCEKAAHLSNSDT